MLAAIRMLLLLGHLEKDVWVLQSSKRPSLVLCDERQAELVLYSEQVSVVRVKGYQPTPTEALVQPDEV